MRPLTFACARRPTQRLDLSPLTPQNLAGKTVADIAKIELRNDARARDCGRRFLASAKAIPPQLSSKAAARVSIVSAWA